MVSSGKSSVLNACSAKTSSRSAPPTARPSSGAAQRWQHAPPTARASKEPNSSRRYSGHRRSRRRGPRDAPRRRAACRPDPLRRLQRHAALEIEALTELREAQKPIILVFNQIDRYPETDRDQIYAKIKDERVKHLIRPEDVVMTAARPDPYKVKIQLPDGTTTDPVGTPRAR